MADPNRLAISTFIGTALVLLVSSASAGVMQVAPPVNMNTTENDVDVFLFQESTGNDLSGGQLVDHLVTGAVTISLPAHLVSGNVTNANVDSWMLFANSEDEVAANSYRESVTFSKDILGIIALNAGGAAANLLVNTDATLGHPGSNYNGAMNLGEDIIRISADKRTISFDPTTVVAGIDRVRILVEGGALRVVGVAEPGALALLSLGMLGVWLGGRRRAGC